uniref:Ionotropic glutamate receptor L-glutamate and glycine-binding domain-containing protein n=1 Tax=Anopheles atroparvus TaxID=41427 RepID=A0A182IQR1_ANOAO
MVRTIVLFVGLLMFGRAGGSSALVNKNESDFKLSLVVNVLDRILLEASAMPIETCSLVGTNESFFRDVVDRLLSRSGNRFMVPTFNNAVARYAPTKQLVIIGGDSVDDIMGSLVNAFRYQNIRFFSTNSRDIFVILVLSDLRFVESKKFFLLRVFFCTLNLLIVLPSPTPYQQPILIATDYADRALTMPHDTPIDSLFADRFRSQDVPPVNVWGSVRSALLWHNAHGDVVGPDWSVFRTVLEHMGLRWKVTLHQYTPSLVLNEWVNEQLDRGTMDIYIDRGFLPTELSVVHFLPEMNGFCMVVPKAKKYKILRHLLSPMQPTCWIVLGGTLFVGSLIAHRYFRNSLLSTLLFGANLNAPGVSRTERVLLFCSLVVFFVLSEAYQAKLLSSMSSQRYPPDPRTVAEFLHTDIILELDYTTAMIVAIRSEFAGRVTNHTDYRFTFDGNLEHGVLMLCPSAWVHLLQWTRQQYERHGHNVRPAVHIVGEKLLTLVASYSFSGAFTLNPRFRGYLDRLFESGLVTYWQMAEGGQQLYERRFEFLDSTVIAFSDLTAARSNETG